MTDLPIIFSGPMVQALLAGRKTMTRRLAWRQVVDKDVPTAWQRARVGDRLWVKEGWRWNVDYHTPAYRADYPDGDSPPVPGNFYRWRSPLHLARADSRLTLFVTATKVERLQEISEEDAMAEGADRAIAGGMTAGGYSATFRTGFVVGIWQRLHGNWLDNPEVVALSFTVHKSNIDAIQKDRAA